MIFVINNYFFILIYIKDSTVVFCNSVTFGTFFSADAGFGVPKPSILHHVFCNRTVLSCNKLQITTPGSRRTIQSSFRLIAAVAFFVACDIQLYKKNRLIVGLNQK